MENQTAFDLNHAIQNWRENLAQSPAFSSENLDELESHLRDSMVALQTRNLSAEEAFLIATKRIGKHNVLESEFGKINGRAVWFDRGLWILLAFQVWTLISGISSLALSIVSPLGIKLNDMLPGFGQHKVGEISLRNAVSIICSPLMMAIVLGVLAWCLVGWRQRVLDVVQASFKRPWALAGGLFLACAIFRIAGTLAMRFWYFPIVYHAPRGVSTTALILVPFSDAIFAGLTVLVARKRLQIAR